MTCSASNIGVTLKCALVFPGHTRYYISLTYRVLVLTTSQPSYLNNLISVQVQPLRSTRSSSVVTLSRPPTISSLKITDRSFRYASPRLWNQLRFIPSAWPVMSGLTSSLICQLISITTTTLIIHHSFTPGSKPTFSSSTNPSHLRLLPVSFLLHVKYTLSYRIRIVMC